MMALILLTLTVSVFGEYLLHDSFVKCGPEYQGRGPWNGYSSLSESNVQCTDDGRVNLFIDDKESTDFDDEVLTFSGGGIAYQLQGNDVKGSYYVTVALPAEQPEDEGTGVHFTMYLVPVGYPVSFTNPGGELTDQCADFGAFRMLVGFCPGSMLLYFDTCSGLPVRGYIDRPFGKTWTYGIEITDSKVNVYSQGEIIFNHTGVIPTGDASDYFLMFAARSGDADYGQFDWLGQPYNVYIEDITVNDNSLTLVTEIEDNKGWSVGFSTLMTVLISLIFFFLY